MRMAWLVLGAAAALAGCETTKEREARISDADHRQCLAWKASPGTELYVLCRQMIAQDRREQDRADRRDKIGALMMMQGNRPVISTPQPQPMFRQYVINGRMVNCSTLGTTTNCY